MDVIKTITYTIITFCLLRETGAWETDYVTIPRKLSIAAAKREIKKIGGKTVIPQTVKVEYKKVVYTMPLDTFVLNAKII